MDTDPAAAAAAAPWVVIEATVDLDDRTVRGTMTAPAAVRLADPLASLPDPTDDLQLLRTFPGRPSRGDVRWTAGDDGHLSFVTTLPRRFGAVGATRHGLFAAGGWYPQPEGLPELQWDVTLSAPPGHGVAVGDRVGVGTVRWVGRGERAAIAVVDHPRFTPLDAGPDDDVVLLTAGPARGALVRELEQRVAAVPATLDGVVVEAPLRRRLVAYGPGLAYVSDRAFRLTPGFRFVHRHAVTRGVASAMVRGEDPLARAIAGAALAEVEDERRSQVEASRLLGAFSWVPQINALLASERIPFYSEVLDRVWPSDPVLDDLVEQFAPHVPGTAAVAQLDDRFGAGVGRCVGLRIAIGDGVDDALARCGAAAGALAPYHAAAPPQDYRLDVTDDHVTVTRDAPDEGLPEIVVVRIDDVDHPLALAPGATAELPGPARRVALDPARHVSQTSRMRDAWPPRYDVTVAAWVDTVNLTRAQLFAAGFATLRRRYDTRNLGFGALSNSRSDWVTVELGYLHKLGPLLDGWNRPHRLRIDGSASLLDPRFSDLGLAPGGVAVALDSTASWTWDDRVSSDFPLRGTRVSVAAGGGGIPGTGLGWSSASVSGTGVTSNHPRVALAGRAGASVARSPLPHRLLVLGGEGAMRSIPALPACPATTDDGSPAPCFPVATARAVGAAELRWAAVRDASVPLGLVWGSELQLSGGIEGVVAEVDGAPVYAAGLTLGTYVLGDVLGADTSGIGLTAGWPLGWSEALPLVHTAAPELYLRLAQAF